MFLALPKLTCPGLFVTATDTEVGKTAAKMAVLLKSPERVQAVCADIAHHFQEKVAPNGFGAQVVTFDRESCLLYKQALDQHIATEVSDIVMSVNSGEESYAPYRRERDAEEKLLDRFRDPNDPLKIIIVTSKLLTGFDAPPLHTLYLDRPLKGALLMQTLARVNRTFKGKQDGLLVAYAPLADNLASRLSRDGLCSPSPCRHRAGLWRPCTPGRW